MEVSSRIILLSDTRLTVAVVVEALLHQSATSLCVLYFRSSLSVDGIRLYTLQ